VIKAPWQKTDPKETAALQDLLAAHIPHMGIGTLPLFEKEVIGKEELFTPLKPR